MAILIWLFHAGLYVFAVAVVVAILYAREFHSKTLSNMISAGALDDQIPPIK
jgi:Protein of unknown function, DUF599.